MQTAQPKFKWHNEVIAWLNGDTIQERPEGNQAWTETKLDSNNDALPCFFISYEYRIKPKEEVKYAGIYENSIRATMDESEFNTLEECIERMSKDSINSGKFQKRTYLNGELIALELIKV
jgi:hypothetical protein